MTTVQMHRESGDQAHPAINIKIYTVRAAMERLLPLQLGSSARLMDDGTIGDRQIHTTPAEFTFAWIDAHLSESEQNEFWDIACQDGFQQAEELATETFGPRVETYQEGRSGGWLVVHGLGDVEDWTPGQVTRWAEFETAVRAIVDDTPYRYLWSVHANVFERQPTYEEQQIDQLLPSEFYGLKITGGGSSATKWLSITADQLAAIRKILA